ncbi:glycerol-3-phosphate dehydrogenase 1 [Phyllostomus discolor]|uniref:Glycerol-3-phosphate dehydrogenase [NAD(+)], cytoplasmic n=1 Tax=Phyllostomus discolor TaxID=89673 RepID=A0A834AW80_9CHIR|nr:glycerol-3-phosphate dehydrogenase 1 [Phyllostomus discolor]
MSVLMGANIASEVADEKFCETTIGESPTTTHAHDAAPVTSPPHILPSLTPLSCLLPIRQAKEEDPSIRGEGGLGHPQGKGCRSCLRHMCEKESRIPPKTLLLPTLGCKDQAQGQLLKELMQTPNFRITVVPEVDTVEICGALKNVVAVGAGFCDGLGFGDNTKAAVIRLGLMEMIAFAKLFCRGPVSPATFLESCGVADLITTCYGGRNRKVAEAFACTGKSIEQLEKEMLNGQKLQGPQTARELHSILQHKGLVDKFPLFMAVYRVCYESQPVGEFIRCLQNHPEHM